MKKLLAIDVGNTNVKYGLFLNGKLSKSWKHKSSQTALSCARFLNYAEGAPCAIASVVPACGELIKEAAGKRLILEVNAANQSVLSGMDAAMGADRIADAVAAFKLYGASENPTVVMSFGTASTLLAIDAKGEVQGGWIMPGMTAQLEVMHERCALLPRLKMERQSRVLGFDTETHMRNGVFVGNVGAAREWIRSAEAQLESKAVSVATGGWARSLQKHGRVFDHVDSALTLKGIYLLAVEAGR